MNIGTPLSHSATKIMLLGSGELGKEIIISLQRLGIETIAVDRYENAPAQQVAHRSHTLDMTNYRSLLALINQEKPHIIIPEIEALNIDVLEFVEQQKIARVIPNARAVKLTMNREGIRRLVAEELGLPTSPYRFVETLSELKQAGKEIGFPCFIKPIMSSSGKGQSQVKAEAELETAWIKAQQEGRVKGNKIIIEGKIDFDCEITLLTLRAKNAKQQDTIYFCDPIGHKQENGDYIESWQPQTISQIAMKEAQYIAHQVVENLGGYGIFGVELFIKGDQVWFSEVSPRPHDTGMVTMITQKYNEFELHVRAILGFPIDTHLIESAGASRVIYGEHESSDLQFSGIEQALNIPETDLRLFGKPQAFMKRRMGVILASGKDVEIAKNRANTAYQQIKTIK